MFEWKNDCNEGKLIKNESIEKIFNKRYSLVCNKCSKKKVIHSQFKNNKEANYGIFENRYFFKY